MSGVKDKYDVLKILGEGSFGKCYLMRDRQKRIQVCVKVIKIRNMPQKERVATQMEVDLLRRLCHPNIVRYHDSFMSRNGDSLCISMEYCDGGDLASQIKNARRQLFTEEKILHWFVQMALGLHYMHTNKVLHRDLKTQNVFLLGNGRLVLGDLGISKVLDGTMDFAQTCIGTPYYMSPEIFKNKPYSYKSDVWALGCVLYELTTLNHAFDANSLNGLAQKIIKGRFSPINSKYSRHLRTLINDMLMTNATQRPDLDQILKRPFIQKHIINFFSDIASRPSNAKMGEGTMIVRAAVSGENDSRGALSNDQNMLNLRQQMRDVGLTDAMNAALAPPSTVKPATSFEAKKRAREQAAHLRREEENKKMVESALAKLREERETRLKKNVDIANGAPRVNLSAKPPVPRQSDMRRDIEGADRQRPGSDRSKEPERRRYQFGDRSSYRDQEADAARARRRREEEDERKAYAEAERDRKLEVDRVVNRRREEARIDARNKEEARIREEARQKELAREENRKRDELAIKQRNDLLKAKAEAAARRDAQRARERSRQKDEIEQLKRDKLELDRRTEERLRKVSSADRARDRIQEEKAGDSVFTSPEKARKETQEAECAGSDSSDRDKVLQRKREQQLREEQERKDALLRAEEENKAARERAIDQRKNQYVPTADASLIPGAKTGQESSKPPPASLDVLTERLKEATQDTHQEGSRFDRGPADRAAIPESGPAKGDYNKADYDSSSDDEDDLWGEPRTDAGHNAEVEADMIRREEELKAELDMATMRCAELKKTLKETLTHASAISGAPADVGKGPSSAPSNGENFDVDDLHDDDTDDEEKADVPVYSARAVVEQPSLGMGGLAVDDVDSDGATPRRVRPDVAVQVPAYHDLQEATSPVGAGRLGHRTERLRSHLVKNVGQTVFEKAYRFLQDWDGDDTVEDEIERDRKLVSILGDDKMSFVQDLDQLLFLEQYNLR